MNLKPHAFVLFFFCLSVRLVFSLSQALLIHINVIVFSLFSFHLLMECTNYYLKAAITNISIVSLVMMVYFFFSFLYGSCKRTNLHFAMLDLKRL